MVIEREGSHRGAVALLVFAATASGACLGLFVGWHLRGDHEPRADAAVEPPTSDQRVGDGAPASLQSWVSDDLNKLRQRVDQLERDLADARSVRMAVPAPPSIEEVTGPSFVDEHGEEVVEIIYQDRLHRAIEDAGGALATVVDSYGRMHPEVAAHAERLKEIGDEYVRLQEEILSEHSRNGRSPTSDSPSYDEYRRRWMELKVWLEDAVHLELSPETATIMLDAIRQYGLVWKW
jgi:hypothetical protein